MVFYFGIKYFERYLFQKDLKGEITYSDNNIVYTILANGHNKRKLVDSTVYKAIFSNNVTYNTEEKDISVDYEPVKKIWGIYKVEETPSGRPAYSKMFSSEAKTGFRSGPYFVSWGPDKKYIVFESCFITSCGIYIANREGTISFKLTEGSRPLILGR